MKPAVCLRFFNDLLATALANASIASCMPNANGLGPIESADAISTFNPHEWIEIYDANVDFFSQFILDARNQISSPNTGSPIQAPSAATSADTSLMVGKTGLSKRRELTESLIVRIVRYLRSNAVVIGLIHLFKLRQNRTLRHPPL
jgi:hypothetical protein